VSQPLFSIITPCSPRRYRTILPRALASVVAQSVEDWEQILVLNHGQAPPPLPLDRRQRWLEAPLNPGWKDHGAWAMRYASELAAGAYTAWLCDDDEFLPHHLETHLSAGAPFSVSRVMLCLGGVEVRAVGGPAFSLGDMDCTGIVNQRSLLLDGNWRDTGEWNSDWDLVDQWRRAGHAGIFVPTVTGRHHDGGMARASGLPDNDPEWN
jgi:hypothetical protein